MPQFLNPQDKTDNIFLSTDLFTVQTAKDTFGSVRALELVPVNGIYFYEVKILVSQLMKIGWATKEFFMTDGSDNGVGDDRYSIGFDASVRSAIWHNRSQSKIKVKKWKAGDIVGCLIDVPNKNFIFYLNGKEFDVRKLKIDVHFSEMSYYPAASFQGREDRVDSEDSEDSDESEKTKRIFGELGENDSSDESVTSNGDTDAQAHFNFGQQPFSYPPKNIEFNDFYGYRFNRFFQKLDSENCSKKIVISKDCFSARNISKSSVKTVYALKPVSGQGVYFYEVKLMTDGLMKIGWTIESNSISIGFDGFRRLIWFNENQQFNLNAQLWKVGDVLGCLIDVPGENFIFYHNGTEFDVQQLQIRVIFNSGDQYRPAIELAAGQQVYCNFGQEPFRFGPPGLEYQDFYGNRFDQALQEI